MKPIRHPDARAPKGPTPATYIPRPAVWKAPATPPAPIPVPAGFVDLCRENGIEFDPGDPERLGQFLALLLDANTAFNLTSIRDPAEAWTRHIFDSLTLLQFLGELPEGSRVIDVGSGGGLPGVPLALVLPRLKFTLLEATGKKVAYLRDVVRVLGLENVSILEQRAEVAGHDRGEKVAGGGRAGGHRESYDAVIARAVGPLAVVAELTVPFARIGGGIFLIKGQKAGEELAEAAEALKRLMAVHAGTVETPTGRIVALGKSSATPRDYPRRDGEPKRAPLGVGRSKER